PEPTLAKATFGQANDAWRSAIYPTIATLDGYIADEHGNSTGASSRSDAKSCLACVNPARHPTLWDRDGRTRISRLRWGYRRYHASATQGVAHTQAQLLRMQRRPAGTSRSCSRATARAQPERDSPVRLVDLRLAAVPRVT